jgi:hypothetical protein
VSLRGGPRNNTGISGPGKSAGASDEAGEAGRGARQSRPGLIRITMRLERS